MSIRNVDKILVGDVLASNLERDKDDFEDYSSRFDEAYRLNHKEKIETVRNLPKVKVKIGQNKKFTQELYKSVDSLKEEMRKLEGYVKHAGGLLDVAVKDFGIKEVRKCVRGKDLEGLSGKLAVINENIGNNKTVLMDEGLQESRIIALKELKDELDAENAAQEFMKEELDILVNNNKAAFEEMDKLNSDILDVGKRIFKGEDEAKYNDYVLEKILGRIRKG